MDIIVDLTFPIIVDTKLPITQNRGLERQLFFIAIRFEDSAGSE